MSDFEALPELEKSIVRISALINRSISMEKVIHFLDILQIKTESGESFRIADIKVGYRLLRPTLDYLKDNEFMEGSSRSNLTLDQHLVLRVFRDTARGNQFDNYYQAARKVMQLDEHCLPTGKNDKITAKELQSAVLMLLCLGRASDAVYIYNKHVATISYCPSLHSIVHSFYLNPFESGWSEHIVDLMQDELILPFLDQDFKSGKTNSPLFKYIETLDLTDQSAIRIQSRILDKWILCGQFDLIDRWLKKHQNQDSENYFCVQGCMFFIQGDAESSIVCFNVALQKMRERKKNQGAYFDHFMGVFFILAILKTGTAELLDEALQIVEKASRPDYSYTLPKTGTIFFSCYDWLKYPLLFLKGKRKEADSIFIKHERYFREHTNDRYLDLFFEMFAKYWVDRKQLSQIKGRMKDIAKCVQDSGCHWLVGELSALMDRIENGTDTSTANESVLVNLIGGQHVWEHALDALLQLGGHHVAKPKKKQNNSPADNEFRMVWFANLNDDYLEVQPREQKRHAKKGWTKGRPIALKRLYNESSSFPYMTEHDKRVCSHIYAHQYKDGWYTNTVYLFDDDYLYSLIGHPCVFWEDGITKVELVKGKPELSVVQKDNEYFMSLSPQPNDYRGKYSAVKEGPTRIKVVKADTDFYAVAEIMGKGLSIPTMAKKKVQQVIELLAQNMTVHSDVIADSSKLAETEADSTIYIRLLPAGKGLKLSFFVRPFSGTGTYYRPGYGGQNVIAEIKGQQLKAVRDLKLEKKKVSQLLTKCPTLQNNNSFGEEWHLEDLEDCLEVLLELEALKDDVVLEWPEGVSFSVIGKATTDQFRMNIKQQKEWFMATGEMHLDEKKVIDMQKLLALIESSPGRFIEIQDGQFVALTNIFKKHLLELKQYSVKHKKGALFHPLAALVLEGFTSEVGKLTADKAWKDHVKSLKSTEISVPQVPSTLQTEMRDYQILGYQWLWKLSQWGVGACLADDMGLGKTIQALALLLHYASSGPSLVIAPTSVCLNWKLEINRFAPTLNAIQLGTGDRNKQIENLSQFDVMLCSYGLLQQEQVAELLCHKQWSMIILDEAQAIKNDMTKRAKAAQKLQGAFKLVMTGTPIENHLGELWSLFNFINPGFLGTRQQFDRKFVFPIEKEKNSQVKQYLKKLIQPIVLRRTKSQVLDELPPRTEIDLPVTLSPEENAFYEAIRLTALERIADSENDQQGSRHLKILAEITKLRQACCSSSMVSQEINLPSSKLKVFGEILEELLENNHKTLVFSQFVSHLQIIRDYLDENNVSYQYLDGQTPAKKRKSAIDAFQAGIGDVFLISLKAGGTGLNLTAADFVVHMDPWWNPAVEDQASDRAHRIGQKRPVTIYRLITQHTIEEKIVALHRSKRDLADSLLDGSDISGKLATNDLLKLISEPIDKH